MLPELTHEELTRTIDQVVDEVLEAGNLASPPVDALAVADRLRLVVAYDALQRERGRIVRLAESSAPASILLRPEPRVERVQWAVAHEVGELLSVRVFERLGVRPLEAPLAAREQVANVLATRLLLPSRSFAAEAARGDFDLLKLKRRYATASHELIARRLLDLSQGGIVTIFDHGRLTFRRGNLGRRVPEMTHLERDCWRTVHAQGTARRAARGAIRVDGWPVHEPEWKREILYTRFDPAADEADFAATADDAA